MSVEALRWAWPLSIKGAKKAVLIALAEHADALGKCWPSIDRIALFAGISRRAVSREIGILQDIGLLSAERSIGRTTSRYQLHIGRIWRGETPSPQGATKAKRHPDQSVNGQHFNPDTESGLTLTASQGPTLTACHGSSPPTLTQSPPTLTQSHPNPQEPPLKKDSDPGGSDRERSRPPPTDARSLLWSNGPPAVRALTGQSDRQARAVLGKLLRDAKDDCAAVSRALAEAIDLRPIDPIGWLTKVVAVERRVPAQWLREMLDPAFHDSNTIDGEVCYP